MDIHCMDILIRLNIRNMDIYNNIGYRRYGYKSNVYIQDSDSQRILHIHIQWILYIHSVHVHHRDVLKTLDIQRMLHISIRDFHDINILTVLDIRDVHIQKMGILITDSYNMDTHDMDILTPLNEHSFLFEPNATLRVIIPRCKI